MWCKANAEPSFARVLLSRSPHSQHILFVLQRYEIFIAVYESFSNFFRKNFVVTMVKVKKVIFIFGFGHLLTIIINIYIYIIVSVFDISESLLT